MIFGTYANAIASGQLTSFAFPAHTATTPVLHMLPPPGFLGRLYSIQSKPGDPSLGTVEVTDARLVSPRQLTTADMAQFPYLAAICAFAAGQPIYILTFRSIGAIAARRRLLEQRNNPTYPKDGPVPFPPHAVEPT